MGRPLQILLVCDDYSLYRKLQGVLAEAGYDCDCLTIERKTFYRIQKNAPDLVVFDLSDSDPKSLEFLRLLESHRGTRDVPLIVVSNRGELEYELLDAFDFLVRPVNESRLLEDVDLLSDARRTGRPPSPIPLEKEDLGLFQEFLIRHSGLHFDQNNYKILERGLQRRMRAVNAPDYHDYFAYLTKYQESRQELKKLLGLLTVGETYFFRYMAHFEALLHRILPQIIARNSKSRTLRIWSAGCSSGEEPYSIAMLLLEHFPELAGWDISILATDINHRALGKAKEGMFRERALRVTSAHYRNKYFRKLGRAYLLNSRIRDMVRLDYLNLQTGIFPSPENGTDNLDILFCRNVMIYFRLATMQRIVENFSRCLKPGGYLFLGHAETLINISDRFNSTHFEGGFYYRLKDRSEVKKEKPVPEVKRTLLAESTQPILPPPPPSFRPVDLLPEPELDMEALFQAAEYAFDQEDFKTASQKYDILLRHDDRHIGALVGKGFILSNMGEYKEALSYASRALEIDDLCPQAYFLYGLILELQNDLAGAVDEYRKALLLDMDFIMAHYNLSKLYWRLGRVRDARRELNNVTRLLENAEESPLIPYSGGLSRAVFLEVCREDMTLFEEKSGIA